MRISSAAGLALLTPLAVIAGAAAPGAAHECAGGASADITGTHCGPNHLHWVYDTWSMPHGVVDASVKEGGNTWFFITADYAFGHALQRDTANFVTQAGGKVLGSVLAPLGLVVVPLILVWIARRTGLAEGPGFRPATA